VLTIEVPEGHPGPAAVTAAWLTRGLSWAPSYRIDISDPDRLEIEQSAVIRNELEDLWEKAITLILRKELIGALVSAERDPRTEVGERGPGQLNPSTKLTWTVEVPAGGELTLSYRYHYLVQ